MTFADLNEEVQRVVGSTPRPMEVLSGCRDIVETATLGYVTT